MTLLLVCLFVTLNIIDLIQTIKLFTKYGPESESNKLLRLVFKIGKVPGIVIFKMFIVIFVITTAIITNAIILLIVLSIMYSFITYHNFKCLKGMNDE